ncbi:hypothetical protein HaLaN_05229 [Haematococcus lacustris]|uniref:Uncharacterized protein n=1 Tax=Haematococcus lacustris TaxID=44745 RepID=A0A699Z3K3_HAELA|nr:hypothetical protein HaLaN_05229 [Haematococcus lacustris]
MTRRRSSRLGARLGINVMPKVLLFWLGKIDISGGTGSMVEVGVQMRTDTIREASIVSRKMINLKPSKVFLSQTPQCPASSEQLHLQRNDGEVAPACADRQRRTGLKEAGGEGGGEGARQTHAPHFLRHPAESRADGIPFYPCSAVILIPLRPSTKVKPAPQPGRWLDRDCNAALNMQRIGESRWRPLELCYRPERGALPAKGKEYPGLGYKRLRDKPPKAQQQQPDGAQQCVCPPPPFLSCHQLTLVHVLSCQLYTIALKGQAIV